MASTDTRIYIANLGKYNEGELVGKWIDLPFSDEEFEELLIEIKVAHRDENGEFQNWHEEDGIMYEEVAIHDYETDLDYKIGEYDSIEDLNSMIQDVESLDDYELDEVMAYMEAIGNDLEEAIDAQSNGRIFLYGVDSFTELAEHFVDEGLYGDIPENLTNYIDYEAIGRDLSFDNFYETEKGIVEIR